MGDGADGAGRNSVEAGGKNEGDEAAGMTGRPDAVVVLGDAIAPPDLAEVRRPARNG